MTAKEKRLINVLRFIKACPEVYFGQGPVMVIEYMKQAATQGIEDEWYRKVKRRRAA